MNYMSLPKITFIGNVKKEKKKLTRKGDKCT